MIIVDGHCDTLTKSIDTGESLLHNPFHWDIQRARHYDGFVQILAVFQDPESSRPTFKRALDYIQEAEKIENRTSWLKLCRSFQDIEKGQKENKVCGLLAIEGGDALEGSMDNLIALHRSGVRCITLTWNYANELGDGAKQSLNGGLTPFGQEVVRWMQNHGMLVDISHADEKTFWDCIEACNQPVIASHSNARAVYDHPRNLWDDQLKAISTSKGVVGINFYTRFIGPAGKTDITGLIRHIEHICGIAGEDTVGLGADFDGMNTLPEPIKGVESLDLLFNELARLNFSENTIKKLAGGNFLRVFRDGLTT